MWKDRIRFPGAWPFSPGILVVLFQCTDAESAQKTIDRARAQAARPALLSFALPAVLEGAVITGDSSLCFYAGNDPLQSAAVKQAGEKYFLLLMGEHDFSLRWDAALTAYLRSLSDKPTLLTGSITQGSMPVKAEEHKQEPPARNPGGLHTLRQSLPEIRRRRMAIPTEPEPAVHPPEICLPAIKEHAIETDSLIDGGLPLICSTGPVTTLLVDPAFVFGSTQFLKCDGLMLGSLSLTAYQEGWRCCVPDTPHVWPTVHQLRRTLRLPDSALIPGTTPNRFRQLLGFGEGQNIVSAKATLGLFGVSDTYEQRMPAALLLSQKAQEAKRQLMETHLPLIVGSFVDLPSPRYPLPFYLLRFGFLRRIESLPIVMYTGGALERQLRAAIPHTRSYPDANVLPRSLMAEGMTPQQHFVRSKPHLLAHAAQRQVEFTHVAWLDMDVLPHPVCPDAQPDLEPLMDDRIHIAAVNGVPDASFVMMPAHVASAVAREAESITLLDAELKRGFSEELLWERLFMKKPQWFTIHPMPRRRLLFLSTFDPRFLSQAIRPLLENLPQPFEGTLADGRRASVRTTPLHREEA